MQRRFGNTVLVHLEDMQYENMSKTMAQYSGIFPIFSDDIQGLAAVIIAGVLAAVPLTKKRLSDHTFLIAGEGRAATSIASIIAAAISRENRHKNESIMDARKKVRQLKQAVEMWSALQFFTLPCVRCLPSKTEVRIVTNIPTCCHIFLIRHAVLGCSGQAK